VAALLGLAGWSVREPALPGASGGSLRSAALLAACALVGAAAGAAGIRGARGGCLASLDTGAGVRADGRLVAPLARPDPAGGLPVVRAELGSVRVQTGARSCRTGRLRVSLGARAAREGIPDAGLPAGSPVRVSGAWWRVPERSPWPVRPARAGRLRARSLEATRPRAAGSGPGRERAGRGRRGATYGPGAEPGLSLPARLRAAAAGRLEARLPDDVAPLGRALVVADRSGLDPRIARSFSQAGLAHLLAISGLHVGILAAGAAGLLALVGAGRRRHALAALLTLAYVAILGFPPAALRAAVLVCGWAVARTRGSPVRPGELLGLAAGATVLLDPLAPLDAGFQLSFAGFLGLGLGAALGRRGVAALTARRGRAARAAARLRRLAVPLAAGVGAFALTAPLAAARFGRTAPIAVVANLAGVPLVGLALAGLAGTVALPGPAGALAAASATGALRLLSRLVDALSGLPFGHAEVAPPGPLAWVAGGLVLLAAVRAATGAGAAGWSLPLAAGLALHAAGPALYALRNGGGGALLCSLDVGQGDAAVLRTRRGHWMVFDAGPRTGSFDAGRRVLVPFLRERGARGIELLVLSHPHLDHLGGADALLETFPVARVLDAGNPLASPEYAGFLDEVAEEGAAWLPARPGERLRVDEARITVLGPDLAAERRREGDVRPDGAVEANEASVAFRLRIGGFAYVNPGDASADEEAWLLARWPADSLRAILLKVGHHGSRGSSSEPWLAAVAPRVAFVSAGAGNRYGHPHAAALERLRRAGTGRIWRSDRDGTLCLGIRPDGSWRMPGGPWRRPGSGPPGPAPSS